MSSSTPPRSTAPHVTLWIAQLILSAFFLMAGFSHGLAPIADAAKMAPWVADVPVWLVRFIGTAELAGGLGVLLPAATRTKPSLTPLAAAGLACIMLLAIPFHLMRGEPKMIGVNASIALLAIFVAWGRSKRAPITPR
jgi:uncharacterized membrane protein YphA (DoxX/SURF4 family)